MTATPVSLGGIPRADVLAPHTLTVAASLSDDPVALEAELPSLVAVAADAPGTPRASVSLTSGPALAGWGVRIDQAAPAATWHIAVPASIGRVPAVSVYLTTGEFVLVDVSASSAFVDITFPSPTAGFVILT